MDVGHIQDLVVAFAREREWTQFHDAKNLSMALASEVGELNAVLRWIPTDGLDAALAEPRALASLRDEIGDVAILLLLLCARSGVSLEEAVIAKLEKNALKYPADISRGRSDPPDGGPGLR